MVNWPSFLLGNPRFNAQARARADTELATYSPNKNNPCTLNPPTVVLGTTNPIKNAYTGSRAAQVINGVTKMVMSCSRLPGMVRAAMTAGTAHAMPPISGTTERPLKPNRSKNRSPKKPTRAM